MDKRQKHLPFTDFNLDSITRAKVLAEIAHAKQNYGDRSYIKHCEDVVNLLKATGYDSPEHLQVGWLHDCIEDADDPVEVQNFIKKYFSEEVYEAVVAITRLPDESYEDYISRVLTNRLALEVKLADNTVNLKHSSNEYIKNRTLDNACRVLKYGKIRTALEREFYKPDSMDFSFEEGVDYYPPNYENPN